MPAAISNDMERILPPSQNGSPDSGGSAGGLLANENGINGTGMFTKIAIFLNERALRVANCASKSDCVDVSATQSGPKS